jgi:atypical dual specificity phosphatase
MASATVLALDGFGVAFGEKVVLRDVHLSLPPLGCTVLMGPSGTGKSTLLRTLAGYNTANPSLRTWGHARYAGRACEGAHRPALVMQNSRLLVANVFDNLVGGLPDRAALTRQMQLERVADALAGTGQAHLLDRLSQKVVEQGPADQRAIAILRQAMASPALLMVDEPTAGLDASPADRLLELLERLAAGRAVLVVLHHLQQAKRIAGQAVLLANGIVEEAQPSPRFFEAPRRERTRLFLATGSCPEDTHEAGATVPGELSPRTIVQQRAIASAACGPRGFLWLLPGALAGTPWPGIVHPVQYDLGALQAVGITRLVSLTEEPFDPAAAAPFGIRCRAFPMPDMHAPTLPQAIAICRALDEDLAAGEVVAVHCRAGLGRTGTVLAAYLLWQGQGELGALQALEQVRRIEPQWVQSSPQVAFLEEFALVVAGMSGSTGPHRSRPAGRADDADGA